MPTFKTLENTPISTITKAFNEAFADYFVPFQVTEAYLANRWMGARVDYGLSVGVFDGPRLVGFMMFGRDELDGILTAHNTATGVIPIHRGSRLVEQMYAFIIPLLRNASVKLSTLEVITKNTRAIKAYTNAGYTVRRKLLCFSGKITLENPFKTTTQLIRKNEIPWDELGALPAYDSSWELSERAIRILAADYACLALVAEENIKAYVVINPENGFIGQLGFADRNPALHGTTLFAALGTEFDAVRINNIDEKETELIAFLKSTGLTNHVNQFEMRFLL